MEFYLQQQVHIQLAKLISDTLVSAVSAYCEGLVQLSGNDLDRFPKLPGVQKSLHVLQLCDTCQQSDRVGPISINSCRPMYLALFL